MTSHGHGMWPWLSSISRTVKRRGWRMTTFRGAAIPWTSGWGVTFVFPRQMFRVSVSIWRTSSLGVVFADMENPHAPRVFENGWRVSLVETATRHVTLELMAQASHMKAVEDARARQAPVAQAARARREPPKRLHQHDHAMPPRGDVQPHVYVREAHGMRVSHRAGRDDSKSSGIQGASESAGTDPGASSPSESLSTTGHGAFRREGLEFLFEAGLAEQQPDGSVHFSL